MAEFERIELIKWIYLARPSIVLSLDHELLTWKMFEKLNTFYKGSAEAPKRHFYGWFVKDLRQWNLKSLDFMHYTIPLFTPVADGFRFPSIYVGQYGVYDAVKHLFQNDPQNQHNVYDDWLKLSKDWFAD